MELPKTRTVDDATIVANVQQSVPKLNSPFKIARDRIYTTDFTIRITDDKGECLISKEEFTKSIDAIAGVLRSS